MQGMALLHWRANMKALPPSDRGNSLSNLLPPLPISFSLLRKPNNATSGDLLRKHVTSTKALVITNDKVGPLYLDKTVKVGYVLLCTRSLSCPLCCRFQFGLPDRICT